MPIPRLAPSANPIDVTITVNVKLRPYFEIWFQRKKESGETPAQFALRMLKHAALNDHIGGTVKAETEAIEKEQSDAMVALQGDIVSMGTEVD